MHSAMPDMTPRHGQGTYLSGDLDPGLRAAGKERGRNANQLGRYQKPAGKGGLWVIKVVSLYGRSYLISIICLDRLMPSPVRRYV